MLVAAVGRHSIICPMCFGAGVKPVCACSGAQEACPCVAIAVVGAIAISCAVSCSSTRPTCVFFGLVPALTLVKMRVVFLAVRAYVASLRPDVARVEGE
eukprot:1407084-Alexandrium_andersonii.AAC.1